MRPKTKIPWVRTACIVYSSRVVLHRKARHFYNSTLDRIDQSKITYEPGKRTAFRITAIRQVKGRCGKIYSRRDRGDTWSKQTRVVNSIEAGQPNARFF